MSNTKYEIARINRHFDKFSQISKHTKVQKELFNLTLNFTMLDWRTMRTKEYWEMRDAMPSQYLKDLHTLKYVKQYLMNLKS